MKNITLSADAADIERARRAAHARHTTLNHMFRDWLRTIDSRDERTRRFQALIEECGASADVGGKHFSREELNER